MSNFKVGDWVKRKNKNSNYLKVREIEGIFFDFKEIIDSKTYKYYSYEFGNTPRFKLGNYIKVTKIEKILAGIDET